MKNSSIPICRSDQGEKKVPKSGYGRLFSMAPAVRMIAVMVVLTFGAGPLYGQSPSDALYIDGTGRVGIGTTDPQATLDVVGKLSVSDNTTLSNCTVTGSLTARTLDVDGKAVISNVFIGDVGHGSNWAGFSHRESAGQTSYGFLQDAAGHSSLINKKSGGGHIGLRIDNQDKMVMVDSGNVGIGTTTPKTKLQVVGQISADSLNGEKPPMVFEVGRKGDTKNWYAENRDIGPLCGDADGCMMKFLFRVNSSDEVRVITEQVYIEQPDKSGNKRPGLHGWTRQLGGGDKGFVLQTATKNDIVPHPWEWIYVRNYSSGEVGPQSNAFSGYQVQFMTRPNVSATVIIYDR